MMEREKYLKRKARRQYDRERYRKMKEEDPEKYEAYKERYRIRRRIEYASGRGRELEKKRKERKLRILKNKKYVLEIDGVFLYEKKLVAETKIKNLKPSTFNNYTISGVIPKPIYKKTLVRPWGNYRPYTRWYYSTRQIRLINLFFSKQFRSKSLEERSEYLHAHWTKGELGFGGEVNDGGTDE